MFKKLFRRKVIISGFFVLVFSFTASPVFATNFNFSSWFTTYQTKVNQIENKVVNTFTNYYDSYTTELANILYKPKAITAAVITVPKDSTLEEYPKGEVENLSTPSRTRATPQEGNNNSIVVFTPIL